MIDVINILNHRQEETTNATDLYTGPHQYLGLTVKQYTRFVFFEHDSEGLQYISFNRFKIETGRLYLVPANEFYFLPHSVKGVHCVRISLGCLSSRQKQVLFSIIYTDKRAFGINDAQLKQFKNYPVNVMLEIIFENLAQGNAASLVSAPYLSNAEAFYLLMMNKKMTHQLTTKQVAQEMGITAKTLIRACNNVFDQSPKNIIRYHLLSKCIFMLLHRRDDLLGNIAESLGFNESTTFNRFIKLLTRNTPNEIRSIYAHLSF